MLDRHIARCGTPPRQMAADGSYASHNNLDQAKARGVADVAFHKKRGLAVADMAKSADTRLAQRPDWHSGGIGVGGRQTQISMYKNNRVDGDVPGMGGDHNGAKSQR